MLCNGAQGLFFLGSARPETGGREGEEGRDGGRKEDMSWNMMPREHHIGGSYDLGPVQTRCPFPGTKMDTPGL